MTVNCSLLGSKLKALTLVNKNTETLSCAVFLSCPAWGAVGNLGAVLVRNCKAFSYQQR